MSKSHKSRNKWEPEEGCDYDVRDKQKKNRDERHHVRDYLKHLDIEKIIKKESNDNKKCD